MSDRFVVLSGCSGGGKSTLLNELRRRGHATFDEPGRRIVQEETVKGGTALPWVDLEAFARRAIEVALNDREEARDQTGWVFFDRGLVDAVTALNYFSTEPSTKRLGLTHRYHPTVFFTPPWPEIYHPDAERKLGWEEAVAEYERLAKAYPKLGYRIVILPKVSVEQRADAVLTELVTSQRWTADTVR
ncbi:AAA family ATPase [Methylorubrum rhodesianum]|uniref:AAA family ATPase n=1 Tax=Methylorubrum rhodesianum TaxID=29427 RepID=A0ABU9ZFQ3_9HYPH